MYDSCTVLRVMHCIQNHALLAAARCLHSMFPSASLFWLPPASDQPIPNTIPAVQREAREARDRVAERRQQAQSGGFSGRGGRGAGGRGFGGGRGGHAAMLIACYDVLGWQMAQRNACCCHALAPPNRLLSQCAHVCAFHVLSATGRGPYQRPAAEEAAAAAAAAGAEEEVRFSSAQAAPEPEAPAPAPASAAPGGR